MMKMYVAVLDTVPDHMVPVVVAHAVLKAHMAFMPSSALLVFRTEEELPYLKWLNQSFRKVVVKVNQKEFDRIVEKEQVVTAQEATILDSEECCAAVFPTENPSNTLKFAKLWRPSVND